MLEVEFLGRRFKNPVLPAAGPMTQDPKWARKIQDMGVGGMVLKTISTEAATVKRPVIAKTEVGLLNCELWSEEPPEKWIDEYLPEIKKDMNIPIIVSLGYKPEQIKALIPKLEPFADMFEISTHYTGFDPKPVYEAAKAGRESTKLPVLIKLSPHAPNIQDFARAAEDGGADGIVAINSLGPALSIDIKKRKSRLGAGYGWISGPAIKHFALRIVHEVSKAVNIPVIGVGGIEKAEDVVEFMMAGATLVQMLSAAIMYGPKRYREIIDDLPRVLDEIGVKDIREIIGAYKGD